MATANAPAPPAPETTPRSPGSRCTCVVGDFDIPHHPLCGVNQQPPAPPAPSLVIGEGVADALNRGEDPTGHSPSPAPSRILDIHCGHDICGSCREWIAAREDTLDNEIAALRVTLRWILDDAPNLRVAQEKAAAALARRKP